MALRYILGGAGSGKTTLCINEIVMCANSGDTALYIVPEQYSLAAEKSLTAGFPQNAAIKAQVQSFERLGYHVLHEVGARQGNLLDSSGKAMLIRKIILSLKPLLKLYGGASLKRGLIDNISALIKEFYQYGIMPEDLVLPDSAPEIQKYKFADIRLIYEKYREFALNEYISSDTTLDVLNENIEKSIMLENAVIWIDNFTGFTPQEYNVIRSLLKKSKGVNICVNIKNSLTKYEDLSISDSDYEAKRLINKVSEAALAEGVKIYEPHILRGSYRFAQSPELKWLEENFNNTKPYKFKGKNERVSVRHYKNKYLELEQVSSDIINLVREKGFSYSQIAVLTGDINSYAPAVQNTFERYGIPFFLDVRIGILSHPLTELIRALFEIIIKNWSFESVFRLLKTGFLSISPDQVDILENYALAYGIKGGRWKQAEWKYGFYDGSLFNKDELNSLKDTVYSQISDFSAKYTPKAKISADKVCWELYNYLLNLGIPERLSQMSMDAAHRGEMRLFREHSGIWNTVMGVLDKMAGIFSGLTMTITEFAEILDTGLKSCDMGIIPPAQDQVTVGDIYRSRLNEIKALFVIGATGDAFPQKCEENGVFDDADKSALSSMGKECGIDSVKRTFINNYLSYSIVTKASDYLFVYCPEADVSGKSLTPSPVMSKIKSLLDCEALLETPSITTPRTMLDEAGRILSKIKSGEPPDEFDSALLTWYNNDSHYKDLLAAANNDSGKIPPLSKKTIDSLYGSDIKSSISRLESYAQCPFSYFLRYNLKAKEREEYQLRSVDLGNIFHDVLQEFSAYVDRHGISWKNLSREVIDKAVEDIFESLLDNAKTDIFTDDLRASYVLERVARTVKISIWALSRHISRGDFVPYGAEVDFGITSPLTSIRIDINNERAFILTGRIDRIDIMDKNGESYVKIIDYKSGNKKFDFTDIYYGMQLQLLIYIRALIKNGGAILHLDKNPSPGGALYFRLNDPAIDYEYGLEPSQIYDKLLEEFKMTGLVVNDSEVIRGMDKYISKSSPVIPVSKNAKDEYTSRNGTLVSKEGFEKVLDFAANKVQELGVKMMSGDIEAKPFKKGTRSGCDFCPYNSICGFDKRKPGNSYRILRRIKGIGELN